MKKEAMHLKETEEGHRKLGGRKGKGKIVEGGRKGGLPSSIYRNGRAAFFFKAVSVFILWLCVCVRVVCVFQRCK